MIKYIIDAFILYWILRVVFKWLAKPVTPPPPPPGYEATPPPPPFSARSSDPMRHGPIEDAEFEEVD